jgi:hypothetical protein
MSIFGGYSHGIKINRRLRYRHVEICDVEPTTSFLLVFQLDTTYILWRVLAHRDDLAIIFAPAYSVRHSISHK